MNVWASVLMLIVCFAVGAMGGGAIFLAYLIRCRVIPDVVAGLVCLLEWCAFLAVSTWLVGAKITFFGIVALVAGKVGALALLINHFRGKILLSEIKQRTKKSPGKSEKTS